MSERICKRPELFSASPPANAALMSARKAKSRKKVEVSIRNLNYRELAKSKKDSDGKQMTYTTKNKAGSITKKIGPVQPDKKKAEAVKIKMKFKHK